ncbi:hypothetical protein DH2020_031041 [Rehmannia glutinosa]|uniref:protein-serine/threonine phosphatase n=1 Tax=Rehmannia glutinosa TaxID=99300 RepID=A0ABR0VLJ2_REHGL
MIFDSLRKEFPAAESESNCFRQNELSDFRSREMKLDINGGSKKSKSFRRKRMELRRINSLSKKNSGVDPLISTDREVSLKKMRSEFKNENEFLENDRGSRDVRLMSYGTIAHMGRRREMEDALAVELCFLKKNGRSYNFFGVYDGHGGWRVAHACSEMLQKLLVKVVEEGSGVEIAWEKVMAAAFKDMDEEVNKNGADVATTGSTAVVAVVGEEEVVVANCGDSRAVLCRGGVAVQLSDDHKPDRPDELERIEVSGGKVINWNGPRVSGVLATSRSIGDQYLKPFVIPEPEVKIINRTDEDEFLILASDGLWDVVSNDLACQVTRRCLDGRMRRSSLFSRAKEDNIEGSDQFDKTNENRFVEAAAVLAELAMGRGSKDNISVIVVDLS